MEKIQINNSKHPLYSLFEELYTISFPIFEQRTEAQQQKAFSSSSYHLIAYREDDAFVGFISYWELKAYIYIEHFAVNKQRRGKGYGSQILKNFLSETDKIVLLEIDPVVDIVSEARLRFYKRLSFFENPYQHIHPPYKEGYKGHHLLVLTTNGAITEQQYMLFNQELTDIVMG